MEIEANNADIRRRVIYLNVSINNVSKTIGKIFDELHCELDATQNDGSFSHDPKYYKDSATYERAMYLIQEYNKLCVVRNAYKREREQITAENSINFTKSHITEEAQGNIDDSMTRIDSNIETIAQRKELATNVNFPFAWLSEREWKNGVDLPKDDIEYVLEKYQVDFDVEQQPVDDSSALASELTHKKVKYAFLGILRDEKSIRKNYDDCNNAEMIKYFHQLGDEAQMGE